MLTIAAGLATGMMGLAAADTDVPAVATTGKAPLILPEPVQVGMTNMCSVPEWEYADHWSMPDNGYFSPGMEECAMDCEADPVCTGATFIEHNNPKSKKSCYFKAWGQPNEPAGTPCYIGTKKNKTFHAMMMLNADSCANVSFADAPMKCGKEAKAYPVSGQSAAPFVSAAGAVSTAADGTADITVGAPVPAADEIITEEAEIASTGVTEGTVVGNMYTVSGVTFQAFLGTDYFGDDREVATADTGPGLVMADELECIATCIAQAADGCNAVSYYGSLLETEWPAKKNCYPKSIQSTCLPEDPMIEADERVLFMITAGCLEDAATPTATMPPGAVAPIGADASATTPVGAISDVAPPAGAVADATAPVGAATAPDASAPVGAVAGATVPAVAPGAAPVATPEVAGDPEGTGEDVLSGGDTAAGASTSAAAGDEETTRGGVDGDVEEATSDATMVGATAAIVLAVTTALFL